MTPAKGEEAAMDAIKVNNLTKRYGSFTAVDSISFKVDEGEIFGFLGPNGSGKKHHHKDADGNNKA